jgi:hypothetical protein
MLITVDPLKPAAEQKGLMNRWHPLIPPAATVKPDTVFKLGCHEWTGGQIRVCSSASPLSRSASLGQYFPSFPTSKKEGSQTDTFSRSTELGRLGRRCQRRPYAHP